ncbi:MAG: HAMP domain-containing sensor histidine kinase [Pseudomonadota bacterium]
MRLAVDGRLTERMVAAIDALAAGDPLPPPEDGESARLTEDTQRLGFWTDPEQGAETRYLQQQTPHGVILLGENTERQEELRDILAAGMQLSLVCSLFATGVAALSMARQAQRRLNVITNGLVDVAQGRLNKRIEISGNDDLSLVASRINATTERLEKAMTDMRVQSSNIAHDLRTPLARLRAEIESNLTSLIEKNRKVTAEDLDDALAQIDRITGTFEALLRLSRIESGSGRAGFVTVALDDLIERVNETFSPVVEAANNVLLVELVAPAQVRGDPDMLVQLVANLIQNSLRYGPEGQTITLRCHGTMLSVSDEGAGIPFADRERVLQPLFQMEPDRQGDGYGLGLSLVRAIAELHNAEFALADGPNGQGLTAKVRFPNAVDCKSPVSGL